MSVVRSLVLGCGSYLPARVVTNEELSSSLDTDSLWIQQRTGINQRHIAAKDETTADIATAAAAAALADAGVDPSQVDLIVLATTTPNNTFPSTAIEVQANLGITKGAAFDVQAVCTGFIYALTTADAYLRTGQFQCALVIGAETISRLLDWTDRSSCILFGDGGGAVVLQSEQQRGEMSDRGILLSKLRSDGCYKDKLYTDGGPSTTGTVGKLRMVGRDVFKYAVSLQSALLKETFLESGFTSRDIDWFVPHQANRRIIEAMALKLFLPQEKIIITIGEHANTSAASIPLALCIARKEGKIKQGDLVLMGAMGGGFTWGTALVRW